MGWADYYIEKLQKGETVKFRPKGNSMTPRIKSGELCTVSPIIEPPNKGDVVLCKVRNNQYLHIVSGIKSNDRFQISNNHGHINGWIKLNNIYGILINIEK